MRLGLIEYELKKRPLHYQREDRNFSPGQNISSHIILGQEVFRWTYYIQTKFVLCSAEKKGLADS